MSLRIISATALFAALARSSTVSVHNMCKFPVLAVPSTGDGSNNDSPQMLTQGQSFVKGAAGQAHCLKLYPCPEDSFDCSFNKDPTQLEWSTWTPDGANPILAYDLSAIDMGDTTNFLKYGMNLTSQDPTCDNKDSPCRPAICKPQFGQDALHQCTDAYNQPNDVRTLSASASYDVNMVLCTDDDGSSDVSSSSGSSSSSSPDSSSSSPASSSDSTTAQPQYTTMVTSSADAPAPTGYGNAVPVKADSEGNVFEPEPSTSQDGPVVVTNWAYETQVVTHVVTARNAEPTMEKRYAHPHARHGQHHHNA